MHLKLDGLITSHVTLQTIDVARDAAFIIIGFPLSYHSPHIALWMFHFLAS